MKCPCVLVHVAPNGTPDVSFVGNAVEAAEKYRAEFKARTLAGHVFLVTPNGVAKAHKTAQAEGGKASSKKSAKA
jgi:hypothetical protein